MGKKQPDHPSGKVRRSACVERYRRDKFTRLDTSRMTAPLNESELLQQLSERLG